MEKESRNWTWIKFGEILIILFLIIVCIKDCSYKKSISDSRENIEKIDSLESEIIYLNNKKDSINKVIDTVYIKITNNQKYYEKIINDINNYTIDENYEFFSDYINRNKSRLDSINNL